MKATFFFNFDSNEVFNKNVINEKRLNVLNWR